MKTLLKLTIVIVGIIFYSCSDNDDPNKIEEDSQNVKNAILIKEDITTETNLTNHNKNGVDYIVEGGVEIESLVSIEAGTTIVFKSGTYFYIKSNGALSAKGKLEEPITFKGEEAIKGFWRGIAFGTSDVRNELNYVVVEDAGNRSISSGYSKKTAVVVYNNSKLTLTNTKISNTDGYGLALVENATLYKFQNNSFTNNSNDAIRCSANHVFSIDENTNFSDNKFDGVSIRESFLNVDSEWVNHKFLIDDKITINKGLKIKPGAKLIFKPAGFLSVQGAGSYINAIGTSNNKIIFTGEVTSNPSWKGLYFYSSKNALNKLSYCEISYGGSDPHSGYKIRNKANITLFKDSKITVTNCVMTHSGGCGIVVNENTGVGDFTSYLISSNNIFRNNVGNNRCKQN